MDSLRQAAALFAADEIKIKNGVVQSVRSAERAGDRASDRDQIGITAAAKKSAPYEVVGNVVFVRCALLCVLCVFCVRVRNPDCGLALSCQCGVGAKAAEHGPQWEH